MTAVVVGIAEQVAEDLIAFSPDIKTETKNNITVTITTELPAGGNSILPMNYISSVTKYTFFPIFSAYDIMIISISTYTWIFCAMSHLLCKISKKKVFLKFPVQN